MKFTYIQWPPSYAATIGEWKLHLYTQDISTHSYDQELVPFNIHVISSLVNAYVQQLSPGFETHFSTMHVIVCGIVGILSCLEKEIHVWVGIMEKYII